MEDGDGDACVEMWRGGAIGGADGMNGKVYLECVFVYFVVGGLL